MARGGGGAREGQARGQNMRCVVQLLTAGAKGGDQRHVVNPPPPPARALPVPYIIFPFGPAARFHTIFSLLFHLKGSFSFAI